MQARHTAGDYDQSVLESLNDAVYAVDVEGRIQFCNATLGRLTGYAVSALLGRTSTDLYTPEDQPALLARYLQAFRGEPVLPLLQATLVRHDGVYLPVELSLASLRRGEQVTACLAVVRDVSARKYTEAALHTSEERLRLFVEAVQDYAIYMLDPSGHIVSWNAGAERIKGYRVEEILGQPFSRFFPSEDQLRGTPAMLLEQAAQDGHYVGEGWRVRKDGSRFWASVVITALRDAQGQLYGFAKVTRDITERREAEQALQQAKADLEDRVAERTAELRALLQEKEVLLKEIHHRVKNNLQVISSLLSLQSSFVEDPTIQAMFDDCRRRIHSMALIHQSLYQSSSLAQIDFGAYLRELTTELLQSYALDGERIQLVASVENLPLTIDTAIPCALLTNELVSNCLKHAFPDGQAGHIWVTFRRQPDGQLQLRVRDDGVGLPDAAHPHSVESFGLQLVGILAEQLRATLELERHPGTTITITFTEPTYQTTG